MNTTINAETYKGTLSDLLSDTFNGYTINIWSSKGNAVLISEEELRGMIETIRIEANPKYKAELVESLAESWDEAIPFEKENR